MGVSFADLLHLGLALHLVLLLLNLPSTTSRPQPETSELQPGKTFKISEKEKSVFFLRFLGLQRVLEGWELEEWREAYVMSCMFPISKTSKPEDGRRRHPNSVNWRHSGLLKTLYHSEDKSELALAVYLCIKRNQAKSKADDDISRHIDFKDNLGHL